MMSNTKASTSERKISRKSKSECLLLVLKCNGLSQGRIPKRPIHMLVGIMAASTHGLIRAKTARKINTVIVRQMLITSAVHIEQNWWPVKVLKPVNHVSSKHIRQL